MVAELVNHRDSHPGTGPPVSVSPRGAWSGGAVERRRPLDAWAATVANSGETHSTRFVLGVWNPYEKWQCGGFDLFDTLGVWDYQHHEAFLRWVEEP